ncbi:MAG: sigma 54-interacting transcriptional regulator [Ignavibacteriaceae bacterium]|nr:sigma 54-interacting transcriptional regulator [Ignavibacteriaceae bacterium]
MNIIDKFGYIKNLTREQFEALQSISQLLNREVYEEDIIHDMLEWVLHVVNAERVVFAKYERADESFQLIASRNVNREVVNRLEDFSAGIFRQVTVRKQPVLYHDVQNEEGLSQFASVLIKKIRSVIGVPLIKNDEVWGVIVADSQSDRREFTDSNLLFLNFIANLVSLALDRAVRLRVLAEDNLLLKQRVEEYIEVPDMIGSSKAMKDLFKLINRVAGSDATVLLLGESGTGKDLAANAIHRLSSRRENPFLAQFCGSIPDSLLESELFGYKKGAFTGAAGDKKGLLEAADNGTFFLDEIADISPALQAKLLRVLENREIIRLGDTQPRKINVRIITATNKDLQQMVKEGTFREDLFYRLNVFPIRIPPLRERKEDIPLLAQHFIEKLGRPDLKPGRFALLKLEKYHWPGNIRQLLNVIQRAIILCDGDRIEEEHIIIEEQQDTLSFSGTLEEFEKRLLLKRLEEHNGNRTQTAESLGVSVRWVQLKLKELDIK